MTIPLSFIACWKISSCKAEIELEREEEERPSMANISTMKSIQHTALAFLFPKKIDVVVVV